MDNVVRRLKLEIKYGPSVRFDSAEGSAVGSVGNHSDVRRQFVRPAPQHGEQTTDHIQSWPPNHTDGHEFKKVRDSNHFQRTSCTAESSRTVPIDRNNTTNSSDDHVPRTRETLSTGGEGLTKKVVGRSREDSNATQKFESVSSTARTLEPVLFRRPKRPLRRPKSSPVAQYDSRIVVWTTGLEKERTGYDATGYGSLVRYAAGAPQVNSSAEKKSSTGPLCVTPLARRNNRLTRKSVRSRSDRIVKIVLQRQDRIIGSGWHNVYDRLSSGQLDRLPLRLSGSPTHPYHNE